MNKIRIESDQLDLRLEQLLEFYYLVRGGCPVGPEALPRSWWIALGHIREEMETACLTSALKQSLISILGSLKPDSIEPGDSSAGSSMT